MWAFQYKHGDKPLEGFTIQRAAGRGGFGEVYYAVSDSGREVALKAITGYEQIELRGIGQCMNLKNPHLVTVFDVKYNDGGRPFVIMEFVAGPSLRQLLDESPGGLGPQKAAFFLREIGKGLTYLHECGIVHRDLKPGNIFYENGYVKIGDYGLSKAMEPTQHSGQTITVGTVHYMAPEIGGGRYDKSIDIYAMGAVLYEMLTGQPPFLGASAGEILIKHLSSEPDFTNVEEPFRGVIRKAMAKNPADRYASVQEMVEAVFGAEHIQQSVSCFSPDSLSMIAQRVAQRVAVGGGSATPPPLPRGGGRAAVAAPASPFDDRFGQAIDRLSDRVGAIGHRVGQLAAHALPQHARKQPDVSPGASPGEAPDEFGDPLCDPLGRRQRRMLALVMLLGISLAAGIVSELEAYGVFLAAFCTAGATAGLLVAGRSILPQMNSDSPFLRRIASGGAAAGVMLLCGMPFFAVASGREEERLALTALAILLAMLIVPPPDLSPSRRERVAFGPAVGAAGIGFAAWIFTHGFFPLVVGILAGAQLLAQALSPWDPFGAKRRARHEGEADDEEDTRAGARAYDSPAEDYHGDAPTMAWPPPALAAGNVPPSRPPVVPYGVPSYGAGKRPVPVGFRYFWLACILLLIPGGVVSLVSANSWNYANEEYCLLSTLGTAMLALATLALVKVWQSTYRSMWRYAGRYFVAWACCLPLLFSAFALGQMNLSQETGAFALFVLVLSALLVPIVMFVRFRGADAASAAALPPPPGVPLPPPTPAATGLPVPPAAPPAADPVAAGRPRPFPGRRDADRPRWHEGRAWRVAGPPFYVRAFRFVRDLAVGTSVLTLLLAATLAAAFLALDVPGMLAAGIPDRDIPRDLTRDWGFSQWPQAMRAIAYCVGGASLMAAAVMLIVVRRKTYGLHMLRGAAGVVIFAAGLSFLDWGLGRGHWGPRPFAEPFSMSVEFEHPPVIVGPVEGPVIFPPAPDRPSILVQAHGRNDAERVVSAILQYLRDAEGALVAPAAVFVLLGIVLICWPARKAASAGRDPRAARGRNRRPARATPAPSRDAGGEEAADVGPAVPAAQQA